MSYPSPCNTVESYMNRGDNTAVFSMSNPLSFKSSAAILNMGYDNRLSLWCTVFASLMVSCIKKYAENTGESGHIVSSTMVLKIYIKIVGDLYHRVKYAELPAVQSNEVALLLRMFKMDEKDEVLLSYASTWSKLRKSADGNS